ncbi:class I SAM-dependent methyltransferase [Candidatus Beckwithbacteria bacterium]|nr:class I SAM-dependent methyltransferase [Candidatus Beckwithbacteria bacterium]
MDKNLQIRLKNTFNQLAQIYTNKFTSDKTEQEKLLSLIKEWQLQKGDRVLEVGGGTGDLTPFLLQKIGAEGSLVFLDIAPKMFAVAKNKLKSFDNISFILQDIHFYSDDELFDKIIIFNTFPHFIDKRMALKNCFKLLKPKGKLIICHNESRSSICLCHHKKQVDNKIAEFPDDKTVAMLLIDLNFKIDLFENNEGYDYYLLVATKP